VVERLIVGMSLAQIGLLFLVRALNAVGQKANRVTVPRRDIEVGPDLEVVKRQRAADLLMDQGCIGQGAQCLELDTVEIHDLIRAIAPEIQHMRRVGFGDGQVRQFDLVKAVVLH